MATPSPQFDRRQPQDGDVVVVAQSGGDHSWSVLRHPGPAQVSTASRREATAIAQSAASGWNVDVWCLEGEVYVLLETYRQQERVPPAGLELPAAPSDRRDDSPTVLARTIRQR
jgi:hypothetical protein